MIKYRTPCAWLQEGSALQLPAPISDVFDDYVAALLWAGTTGLDWARMPPSREFNVVGRSPAEVYEWAKTTRVGQHSHIGIWYSRNEGSVVVPLRAGVEALDELYWDAPGPRFAFGVEIDDPLCQRRLRQPSPRI